MRVRPKKMGRWVIKPHRDGIPTADPLGPMGYRGFPRIRIMHFGSKGVPGTASFLSALHLGIDRLSTIE